MLLTHDQLRGLLQWILESKQEQGYDTSGLAEALEAQPNSYDALMAFAQRLADLPLRADWRHHEPSDWDGIVAEMAPGRPAGVIRHVPPDEASARVEAAFLASVCGCMLGKPLEIRATLADLRTAFTTIGDWPLNDYVSERVMHPGGLPVLHDSWPQTTREHIRWVAPDDDINYSILGMLLLEEHATAFSTDDIRWKWLHSLPLLWTFGPERSILLKAGADTLYKLANATKDYERWVTVLNFRDERCGAMIRADAYGYACPGNPALAAKLAWRDASWTHRKTGVYGAMFAAAAIAVAPVADNPLAIFETALQYIPQRSRFAGVVADAIDLVREAQDWLEAYEAIHDKYGQYGHCRVFQETATLVNTLRFARDVGHGICLQVMQGNDTDSYGCTAGSILGAYFGPGHLEPRWLEPFNDTIHTTLAGFHELSLSRLARRMGELPRKLASAS